MESIELLLPLALILIGARLVGRLSQRLGMPAVLGELIAGLILGPSLLGWVHMNETLAAVANIGVLLLMFIAGLETDIGQMQSVGKTSSYTALAGVILPFLAGFGLGTATSLFLGTALTATSVSVSVQTLRELGRLQSKEGLVILGAAVIDDVLGILLLSVVLGLAGQGSSPALALGRIAIFFPAALIVGRVVVGPIVHWINRHHAREAGFALILALVLVYAWAAESLGGLAAITGAYLAGVLVARMPEAREWVVEGASVMGYGFFVPVFFVTVGLITDVRNVMLAPWLTLLLVIAAVATKGVGSAIGARLGGCSRREAGAVGAGMIARGEVALVMATLGLSSGLLDQLTFTVVVLMTVITTLLTPLLLKLVAVPPTGLAGRRVTATPTAAAGFAANPAAIKAPTAHMVAKEYPDGY
jgi:Kef-type K+ transport system membrane component KefB